MDINSGAIKDKPNIAGKEMNALNCTILRKIRN
jgi:hypothetical protein